MARPSVVWFRQDLRLDDHPALTAAVERNEPVIPVYIWSPEEEGKWPPGATSRWWLRRSLTELDRQLRSKGSRLIIRSGEALTELLSLIEETDAAAVFWTRRYEPASIQRDSKIKSELKDRNCVAHSFNGQLLFEPWEMQTKEGRPYQVFTAFWNACLTKGALDDPLPIPPDIPSLKKWPKSLDVSELELDPTLPWDVGLKSTWEPGSESAHAHFKHFLKSGSADYQTARDQPSVRGTSRLSPHLHFGEISPRTVWHLTREAIRKLPVRRDTSGEETFLKEIGWREFAHHLLFHFPKTPSEPLRADFAKFPWTKNAKHLKAWQRGQTGYPIVDAGMRELWTTGWMHNRVRMIVASFLIKDLLISWNEGAKWFWDTLVDADLANNTLGWQWSAGCGADAAPYFRIFNPVLQSQKFDPEGAYLRKWVPEIKDLPTKWIHSPWTAPDAVLSDYEVELGSTYPNPIVDHNEARKEALEALKKISR